MIPSFSATPETTLVEFAFVFQPVERGVCSFLISLFFFLCFFVDLVKLYIQWLREKKELKFPKKKSFQIL